MVICLTSLDGYHDGSQGFMKQLRLAESSMAIFHATASRLARRFSRSPRLPALRPMTSHPGLSLRSTAITIDLKAS